MQEIVNHSPHLLNDSLGLEILSIRWLSPLESDDFAEYRDQTALDLLGLSQLAVELDGFWPSRGPQWDAIGLASDGFVVLVEAKAHIAEMLSGPSQAVSQSSVERIEESLDVTRGWLSAKPLIPWNGPLYQYANRLAHLYFLQELNDIPTLLVFLYCYGDSDIGGPSSTDEWAGAIEMSHRLLGLTQLPGSVVDAFVDIRELQSSQTQH